MLAHQGRQVRPARQNQGLDLPALHPTECSMDTAGLLIPSVNSAHPEEEDQELAWAFS